MKLAIFDLDNTLIAGDSDYLWGQFLCRRGYIDNAQHQKKNAQYYRDYQAGTLDIDEFLTFQLHSLVGHDLATLQVWHADYMAEMIQPIILPKARDLIEWHRQQQHELLIITATNRFLTAPIADEFNISHLIASEGEIKNGRYTGKIVGTPAYAMGKVMRLQAWLAAQACTLEESWFYSDSHNDIPLLKHVDHPIAIDPDDQLTVIATEHNWPIRSLRSGRPIDPI